MVTCNGKRGEGRCSVTPVVIACAVLISVGGCVTPWFRRAKEPAEVQQARKDLVKKLWESPDRPRTIAQIGRKVVTGARVENVALVTGLPGTGGKVEASSQRDRLLDMMRRKNVPNPNQLLDDPGTAMVAAQVIVPPAAQKGDRINVLVKVSNHAEATNLQSGWLMQTELVEMSVLGGQVREGFGYAMVHGPLVTEQEISGSDKPEAAKAAMVVGGGVLMQSRNIGLAIEEDYAHAITMQAVLPVINKRFTVFDGSKQIGAGKPKQESYIELTVPPTYRKDPDHFANVVLHLGVAESAEERRARMERCRLELAEPTTARRAAWQLEAIGKDSIPILVDALQHPDKEVRFYAAHALAYLNDPRAVPALKELAIIEPAFRAMCLNGLMLIESYKASDALEELLGAPDAETRYGALLALREHDNSSRLVHGDMVGSVGSILEIPSAGEPLVAVNLSTTPEIVMFGANPLVHFTAFVYVNPRLMLRNVSGGRMSVSHLVPGRDDRITECATDLRSVLTAIAEVGGSYGDWVNFVRVCGLEKHIDAKVAINPVPTSGRKFNRDGTGGDGDADEAGFQHVVEQVSAPDVASEPSEPPAEKSTWLNPLTWFGS